MSMRSREVVCLDVCCGLTGEFNDAPFVSIQRRDKSLGVTSSRLVGT
jgi:hypothetical protein